MGRKDYMYQRPRLSSILRQSLKENRYEMQENWLLAWLGNSGPTPNGEKPQQIANQMGCPHDEEIVKAQELACI